MNRRLRWFALCGVLACVAAFRPAYSGVDIPVPYIQQPDNQTCLPTCLTMVLHYMGRVDLTSDTIQRFQRRTRYDRYNVPGIVKDYGLYALPCWYELGWNADTLKKELNAGHPVITGCDQFRSGHFVLITGYTDDGRWIVNDPTPPVPGYSMGGPHITVDWSAFNWRGGVFIHAEPFPKPTLSGRVTKVTAPGWMTPGEEGEVRIEIKNDGKKPWPQPLYLEAINPSFIHVTPRESSFSMKGAWLSPSRVAACPPTAPGETADFHFKIKAPLVTRPTIFKEHWSLLDAQGRRLSKEEEAGPGILSMGAKIHVEAEPATPPTLPLVEKLVDGKPSLPWRTRFGALEPDPGLGRPGVLRLLTPGQRFDTAWVGDRSWTDYKVEAMVYCEYRPGDSRRGFDRVGIFIRDNGDHAADTKDHIGMVRGECYCMTYDSDDGRLRAGSVLAGGIGDFHRRPYVYLKRSGWHKFSIRCEDTKIIYELDGQPFDEARARFRKSGDCGVFYRTAFEDRSMSHGIRFADFKATQ